MRSHLFCLAAVVIGSTFLAGTAYAQPLPVDEIRERVDERYRESLELYREFLSLPNDANYPEDILRMVEWMEPQFAARGFEMRRIPTAGSPLLYGERMSESATQTILVYLQSDGQPVDPGAWFQDDPFTPVLKERREDNWAAIPWDSLDERSIPTGACLPARPRTRRAR